MDIDLTDIYELITTCENFDGSLNESAAVTAIAEKLEISNVSYRVFTDGINIESSVIFTAQSAKLGENYDLSRETSDSRVIIIRIYRFPDAAPLKGDNKVLFSIFQEAVLSGLLVKNLINAFRKVMYTDQMSGISNVNYFKRKLGQLLTDSERDSYSVGFMNIKNCRVLNKIFGAEKTDKIIRDYALETSLCFDENDNELFSRLGGDNFLFMCRTAKCESIVNKIKKMTVNLEFDGDIIEYNIEVRIGVVAINHNHTSVPEVIDNASSAYSLTRRSKASDVVFYSENTNTILNNEKEFLEDIKRDLESGKFLVYYQPIVKNSGNLKLIGAEALIRWRRHDQMVNPLSFIPVAEKYNIISKIDLYVLERVCMKLREWIDMGIETVPISCNFSQYDLLTDSLPDKIIAIVKKYDIDPKLINIEFKEAGFHDEYDALCYSATKLIASGIKISIDNFGTGFSSLGLLKNLDFNFLKIDRSIVTSKDDKSKIILDSIINMAKRIGLTVVCEGIESAEDIERIMEIGCNIFQTDFYDKAMSERYFMSRLRNPDYK